MAKAMTKAQIVDKLAKATGLTKKVTAQVLDELATLAYGQAKNGFILPGVGKIEITKRKARKGRNPITNEVIRIPARRALKFKFAKAAKDAVLGKK